MGLGFTEPKKQLFVGSLRLLSVLFWPPSFFAIATTSRLAFFCFGSCRQATMQLAAAIFVDDLNLAWRALARFGIAATIDRLRNGVLCFLHKNSRCG